MDISTFISYFKEIFATGVPDSLLKPLCDYLMNNCDAKHIIAANEGNCTAIAAGYYLATGKVPIVYLQNSGIGNIINPIASLLNDQIYGIPCIFIIGWRGEPDIKDEPQHIFQGEVTLKLLEIMDIEAYIIGKDTTENETAQKLEQFHQLLNKGKSVAFVIQKGSFSYDKEMTYSNDNIMMREDIIRHITDVSADDIIVSTTGKTSRELFEIREAKGQSHKYDFLTIGSMGHSSSVALGIALNKPRTKIWCIDGDGAVLMHMGAMAVIGSTAPKNMIHIVINNGAHESVGGMPTVADKIDFVKIALGCGYLNAERVDDFTELDKVLRYAKTKNELTFIEVMSAIGSRKDLGRPTITPVENKEFFMEYLKEFNL